MAQNGTSLALIRPDPVRVTAAQQRCPPGQTNGAILRAAMHMNRFVVFQLEDEWLVTYADRTQVSCTTREEAEHSAFHAADAMASRGHAVSVLIVPNGLQAPRNIRLSAPDTPTQASIKRDTEVTGLAAQRGFPGRFPCFSLARRYQAKFWTRRRAQCNFDGRIFRTLMSRARTFSRTTRASRSTRSTL